METDVTIISNNINKEILNNYNDYKIINKAFTYRDILNEEKVIFYKILDNEKEEKIQKLISRLKKDNIKYIIVTNNIELTLLTDKLIVFNKNEIILSGSTREIFLKEGKTIQRLGLALPFIVNLSNYLQDYNLINQVYYDKESLVAALWT